MDPGFRQAHRQRRARRLIDRAGLAEVRESNKSGRAAHRAALLRSGPPPQAKAPTLSMNLITEIGFET